MSQATECPSCGKPTREARVFNGAVIRIDPNPVDAGEVPRGTLYRFLDNGTLAPAEGRENGVPLYRMHRATCDAMRFL